jgi:predicted TPR repeat methyltransferase
MPVMSSDAFGLPDEGVVQGQVSRWAATDPGFGALLKTGLPTGQALGRWGLQLLKENRLADAALVLRSAAALARSDPVLWTNYGMAMDRTGSLAEAAACFERSLSLSRHQPDTWLLLGLVRKKQGEAAAAETAYRSALEQDATMAIAWQCLGLLKEEGRDYAGAIECLAECVKHGGASAPVLGDLGKLHCQTGKFPEAHDAYRRALDLEAGNAHYRKMLRETRFLRDMIEGVAVEEAMATAKTSATPQDAIGDRELRELFDRALALLGGFGHLEAAMRAGRKRLEIWPGDASAEYLLQAISGTTKLDRSPERFIVEHFDALARRFDAHLVNELAYDMPAKLVAAVRACTPEGHLYDALDAGCGTGLCGPLLRPLARTLSGVDLSSRMLEGAAARDVYDTLACEELVGFLQRSPDGFDLVVAADVLIYFGDLSPIFAAAAGAMRAGGLLAFSTETGAEAGYRLKPSCHFTHAPDYVRAAAGESFGQELCAETTIRLEANAPVAGNLFLFRRR